MKAFKSILIGLLIASQAAFAGLPPTTSKVSGDSSDLVTFKYQFPNFTGSHTGTTISLGVNSVAGGGTGLATLTANNVILGNGTSAVQFVAPGTSGNTLQSNGTTWVSGSNPAAILAIASKTANYTLTSSDDVVLVSGAGGAFTLTLPDATTATKKLYRIKRTDNTLANKVSIATTSAQLIDGNAGTTYGLFTQNEEYELIPDGANWQIAQHKTITPKVAFTPTSVSLPGSGNGFWWRVGDQIFYDIRWTLTAGLSGGPNFSGYLFTGLTVDTNKILTVGTSRLHVGQAMMYDADVGEYMGIIAFDSPYTTANINGPNGQDQWSPTIPNTWASGDAVRAMFSLPITGWTE